MDTRVHECTSKIIDFSFSLQFCCVGSDSSLPHLLPPLLPQKKKKKNIAVLYKYNNNQYKIVIMMMNKKKHYSVARRCNNLRREQDTGNRGHNV